MNDVDIIAVPEPGLERLLLPLFSYLVPAGFPSPVCYVELRVFCF